MANVTTTLKLPKDLKRRVAPLASRSGKSAHAWMVDALAREIERTERQEAFVDEAEAAAREIDGGGPVYAADDVHAYILARLAGEPSRKPPPHRRRRRN